MYMSANRMHATGILMEQMPVKLRQKLVIELMSRYGMTLTDSENNYLDDYFKYLVKVEAAMMDKDPSLEKHTRYSK